MRIMNSFVYRERSWKAMKPHHFYTKHLATFWTNNFMLQLSDTDPGHARPERVKSWPCLCENRIFIFTWFRGPWENHKKSTLQQQSSPNGRTRMGPKSDTGYGMENVGLFDENSELCWIEFPDTILISSIDSNKRLYSQKSDWDRFWRFYPFVQITPDETGTKFNILART